MTLRGSVVAVAIFGIGAIVGGLAFSAYQERVSGEVGPRLHRECVSVVDTVLGQEPRTVEPSRLDYELRKLGLQPPTEPFISREDDWKASGGQEPYRTKTAKLRAEHEENWRKLRDHPRYQEAWEIAYNGKRHEAIKRCVKERGRREGVLIP